VGTRVSAPVSAPAPPLAPPRRFPVSPSSQVSTSSHRFISTPHNEAAFPTSRAPPQPRYHQPSPSRCLPIPSSCPSPSGEGTQGPGVRAGPLSRATDQANVCPGPLAVRRFGSGKRLSTQSTTLALESLPWRGEKKRGRKELAPTVDLVAHLPTLSLPLQGGDSRSTETMGRPPYPQAASVKRRRRKPTAQT
jgi:hypothetical protein